MLCIVLHPLPRYVDEKSPLHSWMNAAAGYTIEVAAYKRRQKAKSKTDNGPRDFVSNRINRCRGTIQPQRHVTCSTRGLLDPSSSPFRCPPADHNGNPLIRHRYPWNTYIHASNVRERSYCVCLHVMCARFTRKQSG